MTLFPLWAIGTWGGRRKASLQAAAPHTYVNVRENLPAGEQAHFIAFRLDYPARFVTRPQPSNNVINLVRRRRYGVPQEEVCFSVCSIYDPTPDQGHAAHYARIMAALRAKFVESSRYREILSGPETVNGVVGETLCLEGEEGGEPMRLKIIALLPANGQNGVLITMTATRFAPEIKTAVDLGQVGDSAEILRSFRWQ